MNKRVNKSMSSDKQSVSGSTFGASGSEDTEFGKLVVKSNLATPEEVKECIKIQKRLAEEDEYKPLREILVEKGFITERQSKRLTEQLEGTKRHKQQIPGYQILEKIGKGAMATVYKARQVSLDRIVAIKVLPKRYSENPEFVDRFYREGKAAAKLNHPNIVQAIDVGEAGGYHYFVMEYVDGHTVYDKLVANGRYSETEALDIIIAIADALNHAHKRGFIHRDVKPKNIMITKEGIPKLADMGLAREVSDTRLAESEAGRAYGTPYYISPEQIRGEVNIDFRADIYSLGATFYHMVTGRVPFDASNPTGVMLKHLRSKLTPPDHINPELSVGTAEVIEIMMAKKPHERYNSTEELLEDLKSIRNGQPPLHARRIFDMSQLVNIETEGMAVDNMLDMPVSHQKQLRNEDAEKWKIIAIVVILFLVVSLLANIVFIFAR